MSAPSRFRFLLKPHWLVLTIAIGVLVPVMIGLGFWQLDRLDLRRAYNTRVAAGREAPPVAFESLVEPGMERADIDETVWRSVTATGVYDFDGEVLAGNQPGGRLLVLTPLDLNDGSRVVVARGLVNPPGERRAGRQSVEVTGLLAPRPARGPLQVELDRVDPSSTDVRYPAYIQLKVQSPADTDAPSPVVEPELTEGNHLSYAVQWWLFSLLAGLGWFLVVRRAVREQAADERSPLYGAASADTDGVKGARADVRAERTTT